MVHISITIIQTHILQGPSNFLFFQKQKQNKTKNENENTQFTLIQGTRNGELQIRLYLLALDFCMHHFSKIYNYTLRVLKQRMSQMLNFLNDTCCK